MAKGTDKTSRAFRLTARVMTHPEIRESARNGGPTER